MANIGGDRLLRVCDLCGGVDDHPRHVIAGNSAGTIPPVAGEVLRKVLEAVKSLPVADQDRLLSDLMDTSSSDRHLDCCATSGCPTSTCESQVVGAKGKTGKALLAHITSLDSLPIMDDPANVWGVA